MRFEYRGFGRILLACMCVACTRAADRSSKTAQGTDSLGIAQIRAHLRLIQHAFQAGEFSTPEFVHMQTMPGTAVMAQKRDVITYTSRDLPRGGAVVMQTSIRARSWRFTSSRGRRAWSTMRRVPGRRHTTDIRLRWRVSRLSTSSRSRARI